MSAIGRYHVTLSPEGVGFVYQLLLRNPNRSHQRFAVRPTTVSRCSGLTRRFREQQSGNTAAMCRRGTHADAARKLANDDV